MVEKNLGEGEEGPAGSSFKVSLSPSLSLSLSLFFSVDPSFPIFRIDISILHSSSNFFLFRPPDSAWIYLLLCVLFRFAQSWIEEEDPGQLWKGGLIHCYYFSPKEQTFDGVIPSRSVTSNPASLAPSIMLIRTCGARVLMTRRSYVRHGHRVRVCQAHYVCIIEGNRK